MMANPFLLLSTLIGSFLAFYTVAFLVEAIFILFRIKQPRFRSSLRLVPFFCLIFDFMFTNLSVANFLNPLSCNSCVQEFILRIFFPQLKSYLAINEISLVRYLASENQHLLFPVLFILFCSITLFFVMRLLYQIFFLTNSLRSMVRNGSICNRPIENERLNFLLQKGQVRIYVSDEIQIPLAAYRRIIILPRGIGEEFSQAEFESVVAHELEHLRWGDPLLRLFTLFVSTLFWWVPTRVWIKRLEHDQELASDWSVMNYGLGLGGASLASALVKVIQQAKAETREAVCFLTRGASFPLVRLQIMLGLCPIHWGSSIGWGIVGIALGPLILLLCLG